MALEGYSFAAHGVVFDIGENTGLLKHKLWKKGNMVKLVEPTVLKKYSANHGTASKKEILDAFMARDPEGYDILKAIVPIKVSIKEGKNGRITGTVSSPASDIIDAYYLARYLYRGEDKL